MKRQLLATASAFTLVLLFAGSAFGATVDKTVDFVLDEWINLELVDGGVTVHRVRLTEATGSFARIQAGAYDRKLQLQLEFTNEGDPDWRAKVVVEWLDAGGRVIEGLSGNMELDGDKRRAIRDTAGTALRYGIQQARQLHIAISTEPD